MLRRAIETVRAFRFVASAEQTGTHHCEHANDARAGLIAGRGFTL